MRYDPDDAEVKAFIRTTDLKSYSLIAKVLEATFGADRAWPVAMIRAERALAVRPGPRHQYRDDPLIVAFIRDRMDLGTLDELVSEGEATFGDRFPSRTSCHRMIQNLRAEASQGARTANDA